MLTFLLLSPAAHAFCGTYVGSAGSELYNSAAKVALARDGTRTTITLANDFEGAVTDFALVIPVPEVLTADDVSLADTGLFDRLDAYSSPRLVSYQCSDFYYYDYAYGVDGSASGCLGCGAKDMMLSDSGAVMTDSTATEWADAVTVESSFTEGNYEFVVLSSEDSEGLVGWLGANGYAIPAGAEALLQEYIDAGSYFFAAKVVLNELEVAPTWLPPLQFGYDADTFALPVRIGTISSSGEQDLLVFTITSIEDGMTGIANYDQVAVADECMWEDQGEGFGEFYTNTFLEQMFDSPRASWLTEYSWQPTNCDPCSGEPPSEQDLVDLGWDRGAYDAHFTRLHMHYTPDQVDQDLAFYASGQTTQDQVKYIVYNQSLESMFPICGEGMATDPGTCDEEVAAKQPPRRTSTAGGWVMLAAAFGAWLVRKRG